MNRSLKRQIDRQCCRRIRITKVPRQIWDKVRNLLEANIVDKMWNRVENQLYDPKS